jgi:hypothetical protein
MKITYVYHDLEKNEEEKNTIGRLVGARIGAITGLRDYSD